MVWGGLSLVSVTGLDGPVARCHGFERSADILR